MFRFFMIFFCVLAVEPVLGVYPDSRATKADEYTIDPREYVQWGDGVCNKPYDGMLQMVRCLYDDSEYDDLECLGTCTAQYVAPDIILTARHCVESNNKGFSTTNFMFKDCQGKIVRAILEAYGDERSGARSSYDWALLRVVDNKFNSKSYFNVYDGGQDSKGFWVDNPGFGSLPILSDAQVKDLRQKTLDFAKNDAQQDISDVNENVIIAKYIKRVFNMYISQDDMRLKVHKHCGIGPAKNTEIVSSCYNWPGNSGGAYYTQNDSLLRGIVSEGVPRLPQSRGIGRAVPTAKIYTVLERMKKARLNKKDADSIGGVQFVDGKVINLNKNKDSYNMVVPHVSDAWGPDDLKMLQFSNDAFVQFDTELRDMDRDLTVQLNKIEKMSDSEFLLWAAQVSEYNKKYVLYKRYEQARSREQSLPNKVLDALSMGGTGIGGMQLASGLAEKSSDADAERDMRAYLATFRCEYGDGVSVPGGTKDVQTPVSPELIQQVSEYKQLASSVREIKSALGMVAGIESEIVSDTATTGLYGNVGGGVQSGAFTSLSRALMDTGGADAAAWTAQKHSSENKVKSGTIVGGVGAVGGGVVNIIVNNVGKKGNKTTDSQNQTRVDSGGN